MRLHEISVNDYGPLDEELHFGNGLEVVYGPNESGKTLLVDALLMMLTGQNDDDRVGQDPIGYVRLQEPDGSRRLDDDETVMDRLETYYELSIGANEFRNTFVVRGADSKLTSEDVYYDRATDVVAESLVKDIDRVRKEVRFAGRVTPSGLLIDRSTELETRTHHARAEDFLGRIEDSLAEAEEDDARQLEADYYEAERQVEEKAEEVERLKEAQQHREFETQSENRDCLEEVLNRLAELPAQDNLDDLEDEVDGVHETADEVKAIETRREESADNARRGIVATGVALVASLVAGSWALASLGPSLFGFVLVGVVVAILTAVPAVVSWYFWRVREAAQTELSDLESARSTALQRGRKLGIDAENLAELAVEIDRLQDERDELRRKASQLQGELNAGLGLSGDSPAETLQLAGEELDRRQTDLPTPVEIEFSEEQLTKVEAKLDELEALRDGLESELEDFREEIQNLAEKAAEIPFGDYGVEPPPTNVQTINGLEETRERIENLVDTIDIEADNARAADDILKELKETEQSRVGELFFGAESAVSEYLSRITDGRYERVAYDEGENDLRLHLDNGSVIRPGQLSESTFDQLYFSVRLAFAEQLLDGESGFFILDDAFLAADADRFERQVDIVSDLLDDGWQTVYFTAKDADRDNFAKLSDASVHSLAPLE